MTVAIQRVRRRLAAVLIVGQSGARPKDESAFSAALGRIFDDIVTPLAEQFEGHLVKRTGEGGLIEFASVLEAARCALVVQEQLAARNDACAPDERLELRMGINLGDVIIEADDIYGDGVNIAARLAALAQPATIYVAGTVVDHLHGKLDETLIDLGPHTLKNIERPVRVYRLGADRPGEKRSAPPTATAFETKPAIAVLPFANFSRDPEQEYFADGITEDIISTLAGWRAFPVIARNSTFMFKGQAVDVKQVGRQLGARYVLEGSVRRTGPRVRVTAQLIDAERGDHLVAEKWDREITDLFALQDEVVLAIVGAIEPELLKVERERFARTPQQQSVDAYDCYQRGLWHHYRHTKDDNVQAQTLFRQAIAHDANHHQALAALSIAVCNAAYLGWASDAERNYDEAFELGERAVGIDARDPAAHFALGLVAMYTTRPDLAIAEMRQAIALNPSYAAAHVLLGQLLNYAGEPEAAIGSAEKGIRLSPHDPRMFIWLVALAAAYFQLRRYDEAIEAGRRSWVLNRNWPHGLRYVVSALAHLDRLPEAQEALVELRRFDANAAIPTAIYARLYRRPEDIEHIVSGLRKAGLE